MAQIVTSLNGGDKVCFSSISVALTYLKRQMRSRPPIAWLQTLHLIPNSNPHPLRAGVRWRTPTANCDRVAWAAEVFSDG
jgi:hypothetical protein